MSYYKNPASSVVTHVALGRSDSGEYQTMRLYFDSGTSITYWLPESVTAELLAGPSRLPLRMELLKTAVRAMNPRDWRWYPAKSGQHDATFAGYFMRLDDGQAIEVHTNADDAECPIARGDFSVLLIYAATLFREGLHRTVYECVPASGVQVRGLADVATEGGAA